VQRGWGPFRPKILQRISLANEVASPKFLKMKGGKNRKRAFGTAAVCKNPEMAFLGPGELVSTGKDNDGTEPIKKGGRGLQKQPNTNHGKKVNRSGSLKLIRNCGPRKTRRAVKWPG